VSKQAFRGPPAGKNGRVQALTRAFFAKADFLVAALDLPSPFDETAALFAAAPCHPLSRTPRIDRP